MIRIERPLLANYIEIEFSIFEDAISNVEIYAQVHGDNWTSRHDVNCLPQSSGATVYRCEIRNAKVTLDKPGREGTFDVMTIRELELRYAYTQWRNGVEDRSLQAITYQQDLATMNTLYLKDVTYAEDFAPGHRFPPVYELL